MKTGAEALGHQLEGEGDREVILFLNGGMMTFPSWEPVVAPLRNAFRILRCDLLGQLLSPGESHRELEKNVDDVVGLLDRLDIPAAHVLGASFGAEVGMALAALHPGRVRSLAAVTATDRVTPELRRDAKVMLEHVADILAGGDARPFYDVLVDGIYSDAFRERHREQLAERAAQVAELGDTWFRGLQGILTCLETLDVRPHLGRIRCPTLVVSAGFDKVLPPDRSRALADSIAGAELVEHPESGHALVAEDPGWLAERYLSFLSRIQS